MSGTSSSQQSAHGAQEFVLRAPGAMHQGVDYFLGKFPPGFADFKRKRGGWSVQRREEEPRARQRGPPPKKPRVAPLALEDKPGHTTHLGQPEGGITGSGMGTGYFVMVKEGPHFTVLPVKDWFNFRPATRSQAMSLEEAEKRMSAMERGVRLNTGSKLGALAAKAEAEGGEAEDGDGEGEPPDSDEERDAARVSRIRAAHAERPEPNEDMPSAKAAAGGEKGEDWEHEDERADDDLGQGEEEGSDADVPAADRKDRGIAGGGEPDSGDEGAGGGGGLTDAQRELRRVLAATRLGSASGSGSSDASDGEEEADDVDLDEMALGLLPKGGQGASGSAVKGEQAEGKPRGKRKAATPPQRAEAKKVKPEAKPAAVKPEPGAAAAEPSGPPSAQEILAALRAWGPVTTGELTSRFRRRLPGKAEKQAFMAAVKRVSKLEERPPGSGKKFVVPK